MKLVAGRWSLVALVVAVQGCGGDTPAEPNRIVFEDLGKPESSQESAPPPEVEPAKPWTLTAEEIRLGANLELAPHRAVVRADSPNAAAEEATSASAETVASAAADPTWHDAEGKRYEALLVLEDGTVFGRKGPAPAAKPPTRENNYGGWQGVEPSAEEVQRAIDELERVKRGEGTAEEVARSGTFTIPEPEKAILGGSLASDRRLRVATLSALQSYPLRTIGSLNQSTDASISSRCTGTKVGPRHVLTSSHCVLIGAGGWITSGWFHPGQTNASHPNAGGTAVRWSGVYARDWRNFENSNGRQFDYAVVYLEDRQSSANLGWVGMNWWNSGAGYAGKLARIWGYPYKNAGGDWTQRCNASTLISKDCDGWMYVHSNYLTSASFLQTAPPPGYGHNQLLFDIDGTIGQDGSSVMWTDNGGWSTLGVYIGGWGGPANTAALMRTSMHADICDWINNVTSVWTGNPC